MEIKTIKTANKTIYVVAVVSMFTLGLMVLLYFGSMIGFLIGPPILAMMAHKIAWSIALKKEVIAETNSQVCFIDENKAPVSPDIKRMECKHNSLNSIVQIHFDDGTSTRKWVDNSSFDTIDQLSNNLDGT